MYEDMIEFVKQHLEKTETNYANDILPFEDRFEHIMRVFKWAKRINLVERGDSEIVEISAVFHDVGKRMENDKHHAENSALICEMYLKRINFDSKKADSIVRAIRIHSLKDRPRNELSLEEGILMDADMLDGSGAMTVLSDTMHTLNTNKASYYDVYHKVLESLEEMKLEIERFKTREGRRLFIKRVNFLEEFLKNLRYELYI